MEIVCPIDVQFADQISLLLTPPSPQSVQDYFDQLVLAKKSYGIQIKQREARGKGVYANIQYKEGDLILRDQILVGAQHSSNKVDCLVCSYCFCFIGSIEHQIGRKLYMQHLRFKANIKCNIKSAQHVSKEYCSSSNPLDEEDDCAAPDYDSQDSCNSVDPGDSLLPSKEVLESLMNGDLVLPYSKEFPLPALIPCPGGCHEEHYCSKSCAEADWDSFHSLLCTGTGSESPFREALVKFLDHANGTNDIFILAAKVISFTVLKYKKLKENYQSQQQISNTKGLDCLNFSFLVEAWKPISMGFKKRWWDCVALPDDIDYCDESTFRYQMKDIAFTSLQLLKDAIFYEECAPLFSLEIYGNIIGMFELNNLDLVVASPVEDYFIYIDALPDQEKEKAENVTRPFLNALGDEYSVCCQGTAFFPIQSCMNHSCHPNAKAFKRDEDRDGQATIIAVQPISKDEEITISYIDEELPYRERQASLADYGFKCRCSKCLEEEP